MNDLAFKYRAEILRAVLGGNPHPAKAHNLTRLNQIAEHLAECEEAQTILRAKGHGRGGMSFVEVARSVPENVKQILRDLFKTKPEAPAAPDLSEAHEPWRAT
ncbi:hypothetical protein [Telluria beijingensis]|uniref:hypothetical protein n=1 Tax=Telluria beijingensis TaxID=3068633 RepID=UPI002795AFFD|nr:hypothetical protein [Massilia sp. REN29]